MDTVLVRFAGIAKEFLVSSELDLGFTTVKWYGAIIAFGFGLAVLFGGRIAHVWKINLDKMVDVLIYGTIGAIVGARLYYVAFEWDYYSQNLAKIPQIWEGGLAIYGGIIGGILCAYVVCKVEKLNFYNLLDMVGMSLLIGQGIGRWGNFTNQEAFGVNTDMPWGMWSDKIKYDILANQADYIGFEVNADEYVHPTFLYESIWCLLGFFVLYLICTKARKFSGQVALCYGIWYGFERMIVEGLRTDSLYIGNTSIRVSQALSAVLVVVCSALLVTLLIKYTKHPQPIDGVDFFLEEELKKKAEELKFEAEKEETAEHETKAEEKEAADEDKGENQDDENN